MLKTLKLIADTPHIRAYLVANDLDALAQVEAAIGHAERKLAEMEASAKAWREGVAPEFRI